jgi:hypothetical protein
LNVVVGGNHEDRELRVAAHYLLEDLDPVDLGHHEIEEDRIGRSPGMGKDLGAGGEYIDGVARFGDDKRQQLPDRRVVVHYPDQLVVSHGASVLEKGEEGEAGHRDGNRYRYRDRNRTGRHQSEARYRYR